MNRPVAIVDPRSSGVELAPAFKARGVSAVAVTTQPTINRGYGTQIQASDFLEVIPNQPNLEEILRKYNPLAIIPGAEDGVTLAGRLCAAMTPRFDNDPTKSFNRLHKAHMQQALADAGVPSLKSISSSSEQEVETWINQNGLENSPLVIKPPVSAGSEKVFHVPAGEIWKNAFHEILNVPSNITGKTNETAVVQEQAIGTEFSVGTVSANGKHYLAHLIKYNKISYNGRETVYDHVEFVPFDQELYGELFSYTKSVLDALGLRWGAAHNEIKLTSKGPRLIESVPRMTGGPVQKFAREATGTQADKLVEAYLDGDVITKEYKLKKTVVPVFLRSPSKGAISNVEALDEIKNLPTLFKPFIWFKNGDEVPQTVDYLTNIGIIALSGERESIFEDYKRIREMESKLVINPAT